MSNMDVTGTIGWTSVAERKEQKRLRDIATGKIPMPPEMRHPNKKKVIKNKK